MAEPTAISICAFMGPETAPLQRAQEAGWFAAEGLEVTCVPAKGSVGQMVGLVDGEYHMAMTAIDNAVAYVEGQGAAKPKNKPDIVVFLGCATDPRPLIARPEIGGFEGLRGKRIAVDAVNTGFSFMLRKLLDDHGLGMDDYELVPVGAIKARWEAMQSGDCVAGLLGKADAVTAVKQGYMRLQSDPDPWDNYQGGVFMANRAWAEARREQVEGFIRAVLKGVDWVLDRANRSALPDLLIRHLPHFNYSRAQAEAAAEELQSPQSILKPGLPINREGFEVVLELRRRYGTPHSEIGGPEKYLDLSYYAKAMA